MRRSARPFVGLTTALLVGASLLLAPVRAQERGQFDDCLPPGGGAAPWVTFAAPGFSAGPDALSDLAVARLRATRALATNGTEIVRSTVAPCRWNEVYRPPSGSEITEIFLSPDAGRAWALLERSLPAGSAPAAATSDDGGATWRDASAGLPPAGEPEALAVVEFAPDVAYLLVDVGRGAADLLFGTSDGGRTWTLRSDLTKTIPDAGMTGLAADPIDPGSLWGYGPGGLYHSTDGGRSFAPVEEFTGDATGPVDVVHLPDSEAVVTVFRPGRADMSRSLDGGKTWFSNSAPGPVTSAAHAASERDLVISSVGRVWGYHPASFSWIDLEPPLRELTGLQGAVRDVGPMYFAHTEDRVAIYVGPSGEDLRRGGKDLDFIDLPGIGFPEGIEHKDPSLAPVRRRIELEPGEEQRVRYRLQLPRRPVPLDLVFLVDTTDSMEKVINGLKVTLHDIAGRLAARKLDARFGLAEVRTFPDQAVPAPDDRNFVYKRRVQLTRDTTELVRVLERLTADAGGRYEGNLAALDLVATGRELEVDPPGPVNNVPPGQQADFRENALRVVLHATNSRSFDHPEGGPVLGFGSNRPPNSPTWDEAIGELAARDIEHVGIAVGNLEGTAEELARISRGTGSVATGDAVDCDGDGVADIALGDPLVCELATNRMRDGGGLAPAIMGLVEAVQTTTDAKLRVAKGNGVVRSISPEAYEGIVEQTESRLEFDVVYRCGEGARGRRVPVTLEALVGAAKKSVAEATVVCADVPEGETPPAPQVPPLTVPVALLALPPIAPPPPAYVGQAQTQAQAQSQAQAQAQGALAQQEEEQAQLAYAAASAEELGEQEEFAMSSYRTRRNPGPSPVLLYGAASAMAMAFAVASRRRTRVQEARATRRN